MSHGEQGSQDVIPVYKLLKSVGLYTFHAVAASRVACGSKLEQESNKQLYRARQKSNPLGKIRYLWNCS